MILSLLGLSVKGDKSLYKNNTDLDIKEGEYINSIHTLLESYPNEEFVFLGTKEAVKVHQTSFLEIINQRKVKFEEIDGNDLNSIFLSIITILIENKDKKIIFDITHSFRDTVLMSVISTIVTQTIYNPNIEMIYAKEIERFKEYQYELVSEEILNTANIAIILSTFLDTLKVPKLYSKYKLHKELNDFSIHLVSNQFKDIYQKDIPSLKEFISNSQEELFFAKPLLDELSEFIAKIENIQAKENYEKFLFFSELFYEKDYFLHSSTYLIEGITYYIGYVLKQLGYIEFDVDSYNKAQKIVGLLKFNYKYDDFNFPNKYFIDINYEIINQFSKLRHQVAQIRNNLAHINVNQDYGEIKKNLKSLIDEFKNLISTKKLYYLDKTLDKKRDTIKYKLKRHKEMLNSFSKAKMNTKIEKFVEKYEKGELSNLIGFDINLVREYMNKHYDEIKRLLTMKKEHILIDKGL